MIPKNYKKFQPYSYHRQFFFFWNIKNKIPSPKLKFHIVLNGKKEEKLNKRMRKENRCSPVFFFYFIEYFSLRCSRVPIEDFFGLFIPTKWKKKNNKSRKKNLGCLPKALYLTSVARRYPPLKSCVCKLKD